MKITYWFFIFFFLSLIACERPIPFPEPNTPSVLVANALFTKDSIWRVQLSQSVAIDSIISFNFIPNGHIEIKNLNNDLSILLKHQENGIYTSDTSLPTSAVPYELTAQADGFQSIQAISVVPKDFIINVKNFQRSEYLKQPNYLFDLEIKDDPLTANFYLIQVQYALKKEEELFYEKARHFSFDINSDNEMVVLDHSALKQSYLSDANFNGQSYTSQIGAASSLLSTVDLADELTAFISVYSISKAGYRYEKSVERFENVDNEIFAEPLGAFSNINNGLGIFAGYLEQRLEVRLQ